MRSRRINTHFPSVFLGLLPSLFRQQMPGEVAATCERCCMLPSSGAEAADHLFFSPEIKCCTFCPDIPNFLVGGLLADEQSSRAEGKRRLRARVSARAGVTPWGVGRSGRYNLLYDAAAPRVFGRSRTLRCPYYASLAGVCTIRPWWIATCHTWFCKYVAGKDGWLFWSAVRRYLAHVENTLARYCMRELGCNTEAFGWQNNRVHMSPAQLDESAPPEKDYHDLWGQWEGREELFYRRAFQRVIRLDRMMLDRLLGFEGVQLLDEVKQARAAVLTRKLPSVLKRAPDVNVRKLDSDSYQLVGYSSYDPVQVTKRVYDLLDDFDGRRSIRDICADRRRRHRFVPSNRLLLDLYHLRILCRPEVWA